MKVPQYHLFSLKQAIFFPTSSCWGNTVERPGPMLSHTVPQRCLSNILRGSWVLLVCALSCPPCCSVHQARQHALSSSAGDWQRCNPLDPHKTSGWVPKPGIKQDLPAAEATPSFAVAPLSLICPWLGLRTPACLLGALCQWGTSHYMFVRRRPWTLYSNACCS